MKKEQVQIGGTYVAKVSGQLATVRIDAESRFGGWEATNIATNRKVRIKSAQRLRRAAASKACDESISTKTAAGLDDRPPQDIDERIAAAPPSIVPYEERRARAEAARSNQRDDDVPRFDPSRCATARCKGTPVMTYLERPMCQACWDRHCEEEQPSEVAGDARRPAENEEIQVQENDMSKKKTTKKQSTSKQAKAPAVAAKAKGGKKAATPKATTEKKPKRVSALDAAATVLKKAGKPMRSQELIDAMAAQGLWKSPGGKTPHATLYAAILREITAKSKTARFKKIDRGQFQYVGEGK